jgi:hypothetical protein
MDMETERQIAYEQGFALYEVREDYVIRDDRLWPQGEIKYKYAPMLHPELTTEIAKLTWGDKRAVLRFARRYGLLGYSFVVEETLQRNPSAEHPIWQERLSEYKGEPLRWIWGHASTINICLALTSLLQEGNEAALQSYLHTLRGPVSLGWDVQLNLDSYTVALEDGCFIPFPELGIIESAKWFRRKTVNSNIGPVRRGIHDVDGKGEKSYYSVKGTVRAAYWHLATLIETGQYRLVRCKDPKCQAWFVQRDPRQRFCPAQGGMKESRCSARYRMRARRADQRGQRKD